MSIELLKQILVGAWCVLSILTMTVCAFAPLWMDDDQGSSS